MTKTVSRHGPAALRRALTELHIDDAHVEIVDGCVHLHGVASCYEQKRRAAELAAQVIGLPVTNEMRVALSGFAEDERVLHEVAHELARLGAGIAERLQLDVRDGVVRIHGAARDQHEREMIVGTASNVQCVVRVEDQLVLQAEVVSDDEVARALSEYVERAMNLPRGSIVVRFDAGVASLFGIVLSSVQAQAIEDLVRWHDGVRDVVNRLRVAPAARGLPTGVRKAL